MKFLSKEKECPGLVFQFSICICSISFKFELHGKDLAMGKHEENLSNVAH